MLRTARRLCRMDAPLAPKLIGGIVGLALAEGALPAAVVPELASPIESAEPRRAFVVETLKRFKVCIPQGMGTAVQGFTL